MRHLKYHKLSNYMEQAEVIAKNSPDKQTKVGALLVHNETGAVLSSGYNGFIRKATHENLPNTRPDKYPYMIHAEQNLIFNSARHGISMDNCIVISTMSPCIQCLRFLYQCGITTIYCKELYSDFENNCNMKDIKISLTVFKNIYIIKLTPKI